MAKAKHPYHQDGLYCDLQLFMSPNAIEKVAMAQ